jgi:hypothetical protein
MLSYQEETLLSSEEDTILSCEEEIEYICSAPSHMAQPAGFENAQGAPLDLKSMICIAS